jgi:hypothetical protein
MVFSVRSAAEAAICHLEIIVITKREETAKTMLQLSFDLSGIIHVEFIPEGATASKHRYTEILRRPCISI